MAAKLTDVQGALNDLGLDLEEYFDLVGELKKFLNKKLPKLENAIKGDNSPEIKNISHSIKGALKNMRLVKAGDSAGLLEKNAATLSVSKLKIELRTLTELINESYGEIESL